MLDKEVIVKGAMSFKPSMFWYKQVPNMTYIMKDKDSETYKVGRSKDLLSRVKSVRNSFYFWRLDWELIAFTPGDMERRVQDTMISAGGKTPPRRSMCKCGPKPREVFFLDPGDIDIVIDSFSFQRITNGLIPTKIELSNEGEYYGKLSRFNILGWGNPPKRKSYSRDKDKDNRK